jgi:2-dehydropantoate 2-reductase
LTTRDDVDVTFCVRTQFDRLCVETPLGTINKVPKVIADLTAAAPVDWIVVATKTYDAPAAAAWIDALSTNATQVAILQNGVEHLTRFPTVSLERQVPAIVDIPAERKAPGHVIQRRTGTMVVPASINGRDFAALFAGTPIEVRTTDDWQTAAWQKLAVNCAGAVNALLLRPAGIANDESVAELMRAMVRECVAVGRAEGARLSDTLPDDVVNGYRAGPPDSINSIHADRLAGRQTEADARNGVIARFAAKNGLAAPLNTMAYILLAAQ